MCVLYVVCRKIMLISAMDTFTVLKIAMTNIFRYRFRIIEIENMSDMKEEIEAGDIGNSHSRILNQIHLLY
jgi:hypothetical protein